MFAASHSSDSCHMNHALSRRSFLKQSSVVAAGVALAGRPLVRAAAAKEKVSVAVIGCNARGMVHIAGYLAVPNAEISYICDVDTRAIEKGIAAVTKKQTRKPKGVQDLRKVLEDPEVDAISIATPDHWHAPAAIMGCAAGKHVYVEKPGSHNGHESEMIVAAARKYKRVVQMGNQRRSWPWMIETMDALKAGEIGKPHFARCWYTNRRASIGHGKEAPVPEWLDYNLWQGPALERPFKDNLIHYNWHWFWNYGTGELGNNGVHSLDVARWGLELDLPKRVTCGGGRYFFEDDWETPDTYVASYDFGKAGVTWEGRSCAPRGFEGVGFGVTFYCDKGALIVTATDAKFYDLNDKLIREVNNTKGRAALDVIHFENFIDAIRNGTKLNSEIEDGQKSTVLCHLGNIAWRTGHTIDFDAKNGILNDAEAKKLWSRQYRAGWEPKI
jgi:predicted dehydrogenase